MQKIFSYLLIAIIAILYSSCQEPTHYEKNIFGNIEGKWFIDSDSEYIDFMGDDQIFEMNDWEVFGNFIINEENPDQILVIYEDPNGDMHSHPMYLSSYVGSERSMWVKDAPMHEGETVLMYRPEN